MQTLLHRSRLMLVSALLAVGLLVACGPAEDPATTPGTTAPAVTDPAVTDPAMTDPATAPATTDPVTPAPTAPGN